jgi:dihydropteroate synthase
MDVKVVLSSDEIIRGLKHYRRIAKQDLLRSNETENPERLRSHAEARREVYAYLTDLAEKASPADVAREALRLYQDLPFVTGSAEDEHVDIKAKENALENFFLMIGLEPKLRREVRSQRPSLS